MTTVVSFDLSLRSTGWASPDGHGTIDTAKMRGPERLAYILDGLQEIIHHGNVAPHVVVEGVSFGSRGNALVDLSKLHGLLEMELWRNEIPYVVGISPKRKTPMWGVPPGTLKKYATGSGNCSKTEMVVSCRERLGYDVLDDNVADALWLRHVGLELLGEPEVKMPKAQVEALKRLEWSNDG